VRGLRCFSSREAGSVSSVETVGGSLGLVDCGGETSEQRDLVFE
jgi:hypothetical protein